MFTNSPSLSMLVMIWASSIYSLVAGAAAASDGSIPDMGGWNPSFEVSSDSGDLIEEGRGLTGFLDGLESGHDVSTSPGSSDQEYVVAHERKNNPCSTSKMMRRDQQSCIIFPAPAPGNTNTRGSVGNPGGNNEGSGEEHQDPSDDGIFKPLPGEQIFPNVIDWDSINQHGWTICPRAKGDNKPLTAVCDSGNREDIVSSGIGWALANVVPCTYDGYQLISKARIDC